MCVSARHNSGEVVIFSRRSEGSSNMDWARWISTLLPTTQYESKFAATAENRRWCRHVPNASLLNYIFFPLSSLCVFLFVFYFTFHFTFRIVILLFCNKITERVSQWLSGARIIKGSVKRWQLEKSFMYLRLLPSRLHLPVCHRLHHLPHRHHLLPPLLRFPLPIPLLLPLRHHFPLSFVSSSLHSSPINRDKRLIWEKSNDEDPLQVTSESVSARGV